MLGRHGETSLAAMQLGGALEWSIWSVFAAFEVGTIARVGRHVGARDPDAARLAARISLVAALAMGSALALASPLLLALLPYAAKNVSPAALAEARGYLGVTIAASPLVFVAMITVATLQAGGDTRTPLAIGIVANVVHVGLNYVLIPRMGAQGGGDQHRVHVRSGGGAGDRGVDEHRARGVLAEARPEYEYEYEYEAGGEGARLHRGTRVLRARALSRGVRRLCPHHRAARGCGDGGQPVAHQRRVDLFPVRPMASGSRRRRSSRRSSGQGSARQRSRSRASARATR